MLVLSRRLNEKIVIPNINTTVQVVFIKPGVVRLGIDAPPEITVLRQELQDRAAEWKPVERVEPQAIAPARQLLDLLNQVRDRLKLTSMGLGVAELQLDAGATKDARATLASVRQALQLLRVGVDGELEQEPAKPPIPPGKVRKALLVEDDPNERELLAGFLRLSGLAVDTAGDGCDALDYLHSHARPDVVLFDMGLPRCDGPTAVREIRREPAYAGLKIFGVTGHLPEDLNVETGPTGIDRWFRKPLDPATLLRELTAELDRPLCGV